MRKKSFIFPPLACHSQLFLNFKAFWLQDCKLHHWLASVTQGIWLVSLTSRAKFSLPFLTLGLATTPDRLSFMHLVLSFLCFGLQQCHPEGCVFSSLWGTQSYDWQLSYWLTIAHKSFLQGKEKTMFRVWCLKSRFLRMPFVRGWFLGSHFCKELCTRIGEAVVVSWRLLAGKKTALI